MSGTQVGQFTLNHRGALARTLFLDPVFTDIAAQDIFQIMMNVEGQQRMWFATEMQNILQSHTGCDFTPYGEMDIYKRQISTKRVKVNVQQCWDEFRHTVFMEDLRSGAMVWDMQGTLPATILMDRVVLGIRKDVMKFAFFGDENNGDPNINLLNGLWTVYIPEGVNANLIQRIDTQSGTPLGPGDAIAYLDDVIDEAPNELKGIDAAQKFILVNGSFYDQLQKDIRNGTSGDAFFATAVMNGITINTYRDIPIRPMRRWDQLSTQYLSNGTPNNNLVLYTANNNLVLATNRFSDVNTIVTEALPLIEQIRLMASFMLGFNYIHPKLMCVGY